MKIQKLQDRIRKNLKRKRRWFNFRQGKKVAQKIRDIETMQSQR